MGWVVAGLAVVEPANVPGTLMSSFIHGEVPPELGSQPNFGVEKVGMGANLGSCLAGAGPPRLRNGLCPGSEGVFPFFPLP